MPTSVIRRTGRGVVRLLALSSSTIALMAFPALAQGDPDGSEIFQQQGCVGCHGMEGEGGMGAALASNPNLADPGAVFDIIHDGRGGMPPFGNILSDEEIAAVATFIRTSFGNDYTAPVEVPAEDAAQAEPAAAAAQAAAEAEAEAPRAAAQISAPDATAPEVSFERLIAAQSEPQNWLMTFGGYAGYSYSALDQINRDNVGELRMVYSAAIGAEKANGNVQTAPLVVDGFMYVTNGMSDVLKFDVSSGDEARLVWRNNSNAAAGGKMAGSIALLGDSVYNATRDMRLIRIDAATGETVWDISTRSQENVNASELMSGSPVVVKDMIITTGAGSGLRSWIAAWDAETGDLRWRWFSVPAPGEPGHETWEDDHNAWLTGGAGIWTTPTYDPESNLLFFGTGEAQPWTDPSFTPGDNLYAISTVALDADTGQMEWYFQELPDDSWDYDSVNPRMLHMAEIDGEQREVVSNFTRSGLFYTLDRNTGEFLAGGPFVDVNWTEGLDPETGKPIEYDPDLPIQTYANDTSLVPGDPSSSQNVCPSHAGMTTWWPPSFDPERGLAWVQALTGCENQTMPAPVDRTADHRGNPLLWAGAGGSNSPVDDPADIRGTIVGVDVVTGEPQGATETMFWMGNGLIGTAGGLLFTGHRDGRFSAYDKDTLAEVWHFNTGTPIGGPPMTFAIEGTQYVAITSGGNTGRVQHPDLVRYSSSPMLFVFALE